LATVIHEGLNYIISEKAIRKLKKKEVRGHVCYIPCGIVLWIIIIKNPKSQV